MAGNLSLKNITGKIIKEEENFYNLLNELKANFADEYEPKIKSIKTLFLNYIYIKTYRSANIEEDYNFVKILIEVLQGISDACNDSYDYTNEQEHLTVDDDDNDNSENNNIKLKLTLKNIYRDIGNETIYLLNDVSFFSMKFCTKFHEQKGLNVLFDILNNDMLLNSYEKYFQESDEKKLSDIDGILRTVIGSLVCLAKVYSNYKNDWKNLNAVKSLLKYHEKSKEIYDNKIYTCLAIAFVADDDEIDSIAEINFVLPKIIEMIGTIANKMSSGEQCDRFEFFIDDESNETADVGFIEVDGTEWSIINLLKALYHMAVNDKLKNDIYYKYKMNEYLRSIINYGNDIEKEYSLNLLWQLCFDKGIAQDVSQDELLMTTIRELSKSNNKNKNIQKNSSGIIWLLNNRNTTPIESTSNKGLLNQDDQAKSLMDAALATVLPSLFVQHIMISYNRDSRDLCLEIKAELEKLNYKVWIDVEDIHGSSLESMAKAIENSLCVLMCMTEKYKQSTNCRAEAEYAFQLNKSIVPLIMQKDYKPDGIILGSKIFVNFTKYDFAECIKRVKSEIQAVQNFQKGQINKNDSNQQVKPNADNKEPVKKPPLSSSSSSSINQPNKKPDAILTSNTADLNNNYLLNIQGNLKKAQPKNEFVLNWTENEVESWLKEKNFNPTIINNIKTCNGQILFELYLIKEETPKYFYNTISSSSGENNSSKAFIKDVALFSRELRKLFFE